MSTDSMMTANNEHSTNKCLTNANRQNQINWPFSRNTSTNINQDPT